MSITRLTKASAAKYADMSDSVEDANTRVLSIQRRIKETENQLRNINHSTDADGAAALQEEIKRLSDKRDLEQATHLSMVRTLTAVRTWLMQLSPSVALHDVPAKYYAGGENDGSSLEGSVERCRDDIFKLQGARASVARSVLPVADLYAQADAHVDALAMQGRPKIGVDRDQLSIKHSTDGFGVSPADAVVFLAWLHPDAMKARLRSEIDDMRAEELKRHAPVMPKRERVAKLAELDERILAVEREEEFFVCEAAMYSTTLPRRENANAAAILCVEVRSGASANASGAVVSSKVSLIPGTATGSAAKRRSA
jgi:hypothetical protein